MYKTQYKTFNFSGKQTDDIPDLLLVPPYFKRLDNFVRKRQGSIVTRKPHKKIASLTSLVSPDSGLDHNEVLDRVRKLAPFHLLTYENQLLVKTRNEIRRLNSQVADFLPPLYLKRNLDFDIIAVSQTENDLLYPAFCLIGDLAYLFYFSTQENKVFVKIYNVDSEVFVASFNISLDKKEIKQLFAYQVDGRPVLAYMYQRTDGTQNINQRFISYVDGVVSVDLHQDQLIQDFGINNDIKSFRYYAGGNRKALGRIYYSLQDGTISSRQVKLGANAFDFSSQEDFYIRDSSAHARLVSGKRLYDFYEWTRVESFNLEEDNILSYILWSPKTGFFITGIKDQIEGHFGANNVPIELKEDTTQKMSYLGDVYTYWKNNPNGSFYFTNNVVRSEDTKDDDANYIYDPYFKNTLDENGEPRSRYVKKYFFPVLQSGQVETEQTEQNQEDSLILPPIYIRPFRPLGLKLVSYCYDCSQPEYSKIGKQMLITGGTVDTYDGIKVVEKEFSEKPVLELDGEEETANPEKWGFDTTEYLEPETIPVENSELKTTLYGVTKNYGIRMNPVTLSLDTDGTKFGRIASSSTGSITNGSTNKFKYFQQKVYDTVNKAFEGGTGFDSESVLLRFLQESEISTLTASGVDLYYDSSIKALVLSFQKLVYPSTKVKITDDDDNRNEDVQWTHPQSIFFRELPLQKNFPFHEIIETGSTIDCYHFVESNPIEGRSSVMYEFKYCRIYKNTDELNPEPIVDDQTNNKVIKVRGAVYRAFEQNDNSEVTLVPGEQGSNDVVSHVETPNRRIKFFVQENDLFGSRFLVAVTRGAYDSGIVGRSDSYLDGQLDGLVDEAFLPDALASFEANGNTFELVGYIGKERYVNGELGRSHKLDDIWLFFKVDDSVSDNDIKALLGGGNEVISEYKIEWDNGESFTKESNGVRGIRINTYNGSKFVIITLPVSRSQEEALAGNFEFRSHRILVRGTNPDVPAVTSQEVRLGNINNNTIYSQVYENVANSPANLMKEDIPDRFGVYNSDDSSNQNVLSLSLLQDTFRKIKTDNKYYKQAIALSLENKFEDAYNSQEEILISFSGSQVKSSTIENLIRASIYKYICRFKWIDENGNEHRSPWSDPIQVLKRDRFLLGPKNGTIVQGNVDKRKIYRTSPVYLRGNFLHFSRRKNVAIEIYRTWNKSDIYRLITSIKNSVVTGAGDTFDQTVDPTQQHFRYTDETKDNRLGAIVNPDKITINGCKHVTEFRNRFVLYGFPDRKNVVLISSPIDPRKNFAASFDETGIALTQYQEIVMNDEIISVRPLDQVLMIFTRVTGVYYWQIGQSEPTPITFARQIFIKDSLNPPALGVSGSVIVASKLGLVSVKQGGLPIYHDDVKGFVVGESEAASIANVEDNEETRVLLRRGEFSGAVLVYNYRLNSWSVLTDIDAVSQCIYRNKWTFIDSVGDIYQETDENRNKIIECSFTTGWIQLAEIENYQRIKEFYLIGRLLGLESIKCYISINGIEDPIQQIIPDLGNQRGFTKNGIPVRGRSLDDKVNWLFEMREQKCSSMKIKFELRCRSAELTSFKFGVKVIDEAIPIVPS